MKQKQKNTVGKVVSSQKNKFSIKESVENFIELVKSKPLFFGALLLVIIFALILVLLPQNSTEASEKADYAKQVHIDNVFVLDGFIAMLDENKPTGETTLEDDYYYSIRDDLEWLKIKEDYLYNSKPASGAYPKSIAFSFFAQLVIEINDSFSIETGVVDQSAIIAQALDTNVLPYDFLGDDADANGAFNADEKKVFNETVAYLTNQYTSDKKTLINRTSSLERKYVEAKKIILLSEYQ